MKQFLKKHWAFIGWLFAVGLDKSTGLIEHLVADTFWQNIIYVVGAGVLGYFWTTKHNVGVVKQLKQREGK